MEKNANRQAFTPLIAMLCAACVFGGSAHAAELPGPAQEYIKLRAKTEAVVGLSIRQVRSRLVDLRGKVVEVAGTISGTMSRQGDTIEGKKLISFLLNDGQGGSAIVQCTEDVPQVKPQNKVRALVQLGEDADALDFASLLAIVQEADLPKQWRAQNKPPAAPAGAAGPSDAAAQPGERSAAKPSNTGPELVTTVRTPTTPESPEERAAAQPEASSRLTTGAASFEEKVAIYAGIFPLWNPELTEAQADLIARCLLVYSPQHNLDHRLVFAMIACESSFNPLATSPKGAMGLGQLMPGTAAGLGVTDPYDIEQNLRGAIQYLATQIHRYAGRSNYDMFCLGVASYNAGPTRVASVGRVPNIPETIRYVNKVAALFKELHDKGYP
jgi:soluble lytic murein transglycosylase-like protein